MTTNKLVQMRYTLAQLSTWLFVVFCANCSPSPSAYEIANSNREINTSSRIGNVALERVGDVPTTTGHCPDGFQFISESEGWFFCDNTLWRTSDGGKSWQVIYAGQTKRSFFQFVSPQLGWSSSTHEIQMTKDGGLTWIPINSPVEADTGEISSVRFLPDGKTGWVTGGLYCTLTPGAPENEGLEHSYQNMGKAPRGVIFHTTDGGLTWRLEFSSPRLGSFVYYVYVSNQRELWAYEDTVLYHFESNKWNRVDFMKSRCANRKLLQTVGLDRMHYDIYHITDVFFVDRYVGWIMFQNGLMARTTDGGQSWCDLFDLGVMKRSSGPTYFVSQYFVDAHIGWALDSEGQLYKSKDGGASWSKTETQIKFSDMYFLDESHGWAVGSEGLFRIRP